MRDLDEVLDLTLELPIGGKVYTVHPPSARDGVDLINRLAFGIAVDAGIDIPDEERRAAVVEDDEMPDFARQCLGPVLDELQADDVPPLKIEFAVTTAFYAWTVGKPFAEHYWETGGNLERPTVQSQVAPPTATPTRTAEASSSPSSASVSGTTPPSTSPPEA